MKKRVFVTFLSIAIFLLVFPLASSAETTINIKTYSNHNIMISALNPGSVYSLIESYYGVSDAEGKFSKTISLSQSTFDLKVWVKNNNLVAVSDRFDDIKSGETIYLIMLPGQIEKVDGFDEPATSDNSSDTTVVNDSTQEIPATTEASPGITGLSTSEDSGSGFSIPKILYYVLGFLILTGVVFFTLVKLNKIPMGLPMGSDGTGKKVKNVKVKKLSEVEFTKKEKFDDYKKAIEDAENKIKAAQSEINKLKNVEKIEEVKKKLAEDKEELKKLTGGDDD